MTNPRASVGPSGTIIEHGRATRVSGTPQTGRVGTSLHDRYRVGRVLGIGGMGTVHEGEHLVIERRVAIKFLHPQYANDETILERFRREAVAVSQIGHPNIVDALDMGRTEDGSAYLVLELLEGEDLEARIARSGPLPIADVIHITRQICNALDAAHGLGIVHRDLKPENVFLVNRGGDPNFVKIVDFGISKVAQMTGRQATAAGSVLGTPSYMSPEQAGGKDIDGRSDLYSVGVIMFHALTGRLPFDADSIPALIMKIVAEPAPPVARHRRDVPSALAAIVARLLRKQRDQRFATALELRVALDAYASDRDPAPTSAQPVREMESEEATPTAIPKSRAPWFALGAVLALLAFGYWLSRGLAPRPPPVARVQTTTAPAVSVAGSERNREPPMPVSDEVFRETDTRAVPPAAPIERAARRPARSDGAAAAPPRTATSVATDALPVPAVSSPSEPTTPRPLKRVVF